MNVVYSKKWLTYLWMCTVLLVRVCTINIFQPHTLAPAGETLQADWASLPAAATITTPCVSQEGRCLQGFKLGQQKIGLWCLFTSSNAASTALFTSSDRPPPRDRLLENLGQSMTFLQGSQRLIKLARTWPLIFSQTGTYAAAPPSQSQQ